MKRHDKNRSHTTCAMALQCARTHINALTHRQRARKREKFQSKAFMNEIKANERKNNNEAYQPPRNEIRARLHRAEILSVHLLGILIIINVICWDVSLLCVSQYNARGERNAERAVLIILFFHWIVIRVTSTVCLYVYGLKFFYACMTEKSIHMCIFSSSFPLSLRCFLKPTNFVITQCNQIIIWNSVFGFQFWYLSTR